MKRDRRTFGSLSRAVALPLGFAVAMAGCEGILETAPYGELNQGTFYRTQLDFEGATLGIYSTLLNYAWEQSGNGLFKATYIPSDDTRCKPDGWPGGCDEDQFLWNPGNGNFAQLWRESYKGIFRANLLLQALPNTTLVSDAEKRRFEGEAKFMRAYFYFFLARHFADPAGASIPLITEVAQDLSGVYAAATPTPEVWDLIESDLVTAAEFLPDKFRWIGAQQLGRATNGAANALLGKVRLYRAQWLNQPEKYQEAIAALEAVRNSGHYNLVPNYGHNFLEEFQNNEESIFEVQSSEGTDLNGWDPVDSGFGSASYSRDIAWGPGCWQGSCEPWGGGRSYGLLHVTQPLQDLFASQSVTVGDQVHEDPRRFFTLALHGERFYADPDDWIPPFQASWSPTGSVPAKYIRPMVLDTYRQGRQHVNDHNNDRLIRYADVLLLLAEARLLGNDDVAGAAALVNQVRNRARLTYQIVNGTEPPPGLLANVPAAGSPTQWHRDYLQRERRLELSIEGHRYDDLVRWHRAALINISTDVDFGYDIPSANWNERHLLKPIPNGELDRNSNLSQNPGY